MIKLPLENENILIGETSHVSCKTLKEYIVGFQTQLISQNSQSCIVYSDNTLVFISGLLACYYLGIEIILPANDSTDMLDSIRSDTQIGSLKGSLQLITSQQKLYTNTIDSTFTIYTSGSTGNPKPIKRTFNQLLQEVDEINKLWSDNYKKVQIFASTVSYQHIYGLLFAILWPLKFGYRIWNKVLPFEESLQNLSNNNHSLVVVSSPAFLKRLTQLSYNPKANMIIFCSGGILSKNQHKNAESILTDKVIQVYGSSETGGIASKQLGEYWKFFPSIKYKIDNKHLYIKSPFCYTDDWQNTQDIVKLNPMGFELLGRGDRIVKIEDKRVSLIQVEKIISKFEGITDVHVIYLNDARQYLGAVIVIATSLSEKKTKKQLKAYLKDKLEPLAIPRKIRFVQQLPTNSQGKLLYNRMKVLFEN